MDERTFELAYGAVKAEAQIALEENPLSVALIIAEDLRGEAYAIETLLGDTHRKSYQSTFLFDIMDGGIMIKHLQGEIKHLHYLPFAHIVSLSVEFKTQRA
jgi:hypothetical protein